MAITIDATGKACPIPFMLAKEQIDAKVNHFTLVVDNKAAVENLKRLAKSQGFTTTEEQEQSVFHVTFFSGSQATVFNKEIESKEKAPSSSYLVFIGRDTMGEGAFELGRNLIRMFLYTLEKDEKLPAHIVLMNHGVKLAVEDEQSITTLKALVDKGVEVMVCGTCLDYYHLLDGLKVGTVGNMYDITQRFLHVDKVISL